MFHKAPFPNWIFSSMTLGTFVDGHDKIIFEIAQDINGREPILSKICIREPKICPPHVLVPTFSKNLSGTTKFFYDLSIMGRNQRVNYFVIVLINLNFS
jgi:hypothetical protein